MGDLVLMYWLGFFCGFWACVLVHVYYSVGRQWWRRGTAPARPGLQGRLWRRVRMRFRVN